MNYKKLAKKYNIEPLKDGFTFFLEDKQARIADSFNVDVKESVVICKQIWKTLKPEKSNNI